MGQTVVEKIVETHLADGPPARPIRAGDFVVLRPDHVMTHDNTSAVMKKFESIGATRIFDPKQPVFALDHDIQNETEANLAKYRSIEAFAREHGIAFHPAGRGIGHQVMIEEGYVLPGTLVVASDSHSNMYGGIGALGTPVVRTDAAAIWALGEFWWQVPETVEVRLEGALPQGVSGKDVILTLCALYRSGEVLNAAVEFTGPGVASLTIEERLTIANMSTEWGALTGWFPADEKTYEYLESINMDDVPLPAAVMPDSDAKYSARIRLDLATVTPTVLGPDNVQTKTPLAELEAKRVAIQKAYLLSCVNSRLSDLESAAAVLAGKRVAPGVEFYVAAASDLVQRDAIQRGTWQVLLDAGAKVLPPGCGPCIGLGVGLLEAGEVGISATNRNFKGRMGSRDAQCYLASPAVVASSAIAGYIRAPQDWPKTDADSQIQFCSEGASGAKADGGKGEGRHGEGANTAGSGTEAAESVEILTGFPERLKGRLVFVPQDNLNTDGIYGKDYTYREDMTPEMMAAVVMENYDPEFAPKTQCGDILVGGFNFGTGSSREQAATALRAKGIPTVVAGSFSQTFLRNAFNNGFPCIASPSLVRRLLELRKSSGDTARTVIYTDDIEIDFTKGSIEWRGETFAFPPLGRVPQARVVAGGEENLIRERLGLAHMV
ncbi:MAG: homoaconitase [Candidatus Eisenbacteria bacterium]|nr:homoaconitase [Candidatus Eisenbacteria bacterium]